MKYNFTHLYHLPDPLRHLSRKYLILVQPVFIPFDSQTPRVCSCSTQFSYQPIPIRCSFHPLLMYQSDQWPPPCYIQFPTLTWNPPLWFLEPSSAGFPLLWPLLLYLLCRFFLIPLTSKYIGFSKAQLFACFFSQLTLIPLVILYRLMALWTVNMSTLPQCVSPAHLVV